MGKNRARSLTLFLWCLLRLQSLNFGGFGDGTFSPVCASVMCLTFQCSNGLWTRNKTHLKYDSKDTCSKREHFRGGGAAGDFLLFRSLPADKP